MAHLLNVLSGRGDYQRIVEYVVQHGKPRSPRGIDTLDLEDVTIVFETPNDALPMGTGRGVSTKIAAVEALQLIGGFHDPDLMEWTSPNFKQFRDGLYFWGAYGWRIGTQLHDVYRKLKEDVSTRQAVITLWDQTLDNIPGKHDYPCTIGFNFSIVDGRLNMKTIMRSNDVWLGLPYDVFQFTQLQLTLASLLNIDSGTYTHTTWSLHIYLRNVEATKALTKPRAGIWLPDGIDDCIDVNEVHDIAHCIHHGVPSMAYTKSHVWYIEQLAGFRDTHSKDKML